MTERWYVVQTKAGMENVAASNLKSQDMVVYVPKLLVSRLVRGAPVNVLRPLFPNYVFVKFDIDVMRWRSINGTRGVVRLLCCSEDDVTPLPIGFVEELLARSDINGALPVVKAEKVMNMFNAGDILRVSEGVFQGFTGTCVRARKKYVTVLFSLLSGKVNIELPSATLEFA